MKVIKSTFDSVSFHDSTQIAMSRSETCGIALFWTKLPKIYIDGICAISGSKLLFVANLSVYSRNTVSVWVRRVFGFETV